MNKKVKIFTDGSCLGNPGAGGWAAILQYESSSGQKNEKELGGGFALTTNNRMEITAAIEGLSALKQSCIVSIITDSQYLRQAVEKKWLDGWLKNGWKTANKKPVKNQDLWMKLNELLSKHEVHFSWVRGHAGHAENERCDEIARTWAQSKNLPQDIGFVS